MLEHSFATHHHTNSIFRDNYIPRLAYLREYSHLDEFLFAPNLSTHFLEIFLIEDGRAVFHLKDKKYKIMADDILIIPPNYTYSFELETPEKFKALQLRIDNLKVIDLPHNCIQNPGDLPVIHAFKSFPHLPYYFMLCRDLALNSNKPELAEYTPQTTLLQSLLTIIYYLSKKLNKTKKTKNNILEEQIKDFLDRHFLEDLSLAGISKELHVSSSYLAHKFKTYAGISVMQYIIRKRIAEAQKLLLNSDLNITQISFHCGFNNSNYFHQVFTASMGISPGKYRKLWKENP